MYLLMLLFSYPLQVNVLTFANCAAKASRQALISNDTSEPEYIKKRSSKLLQLGVT